MYTYQSTRPPALISRKLRIADDYFIVAQLESPVGFRYYNEVGSKIEKLLASTAQESVDNEDPTFAALACIRAPDHTFLPGSVVYKSVDMLSHVDYKYLIVRGGLSFNLTYLETLANYVNDRETINSVCFPRGDKLVKNGCS